MSETGWENCKWNYSTGNLFLTTIENSITISQVPVLSTCTVLIYLYWNISILSFSVHPIHPVPIKLFDKVGSLSKLKSTQTHLEPKTFCLSHFFVKVCYFFQKRYITSDKPLKVVTSFIYDFTINWRNNTTFFIKFTLFPSTKKCSSDLCQMITFHIT